MRVITGLAKGKKLKTLEGIDVRPTIDRIKEAIFSAIHFDLPGKTFLDLFSGSGQMGIEAISRGAKKSIFVDKSKNSIGIVHENLVSTGLLGRADIFNMDAQSFIKSYNDIVDFVFLDPPYKTGIIQPILKEVSSIISKDGMIICENPFDEELPEQVGDFYINKSTKYGKIKITFYKGCEITDENSSLSGEL